MSEPAVFVAFIFTAAGVSILQGAGTHGACTLVSLSLTRDESVQIHANVRRRRQQQQQQEEEEEEEEAAGGGSSRGFHMNYP